MRRERAPAGSPEGLVVARSKLQQARAFLAKGNFDAATSLALAYPQLAVPVLLAALGVGFSRVYLGHHYPSDVAGGLAIGAVIGGAAAVVA